MRRKGCVWQLSGRVYTARLACILCFNFALCAMARAADDDGITVFGTGEARALPNRVEITLQATADAELASDAMTKFHDSLRRTASAFEALKIPNLEIRTRGLAYAQVSAKGRQVNAATEAESKSHVVVFRGMHVVLQDTANLKEQELLDRIAKLLDTAKDSRALSDESEVHRVIKELRSPSEMAESEVQFVLTDLDGLRRVAREKAIADARTNAEQLAELAKVKLGRVLSVVEAPIPSPENETVASWRMNIGTALMGVGSGGNQSAGRFPKELRSARYQELTLKVGLRVRFAIDEKE